MDSIHRLPERRSAAEEHLLLTGTYATTADTNRWEEHFDRFSSAELRSLLRKGRNKPRRTRPKLIDVERVIDVSRFAFTPKMSGIPRVVKTLIQSQAAQEWTLAVWDRGAFAPVELDRDGHIVFPASFWRSPPQLHRLLRLFLYLRQNRWSALFLAPLERLGIVRFVGGGILNWLKGSGQRTRARVNISLSKTEIFLPEIPDLLNSQRIFEYVSSLPGARVKVFVHDLLPLSHPQYFPSSSLADFVEFLKVANVAERLVTSNPILKVKVEEAIRGLHGSCPPVSVAELPVDPTFHLRPTEVRGDHFCFVGGFEKRKGLVAALNAWEAVRTAGGSLVILGEPSPLRANEVDLWVRARSLPGVRLAGSVTDETFCSVVSTAHAVVYLSTAEGYGLPIIEALCLRTPVLCADTPINRYFAEKYGGIKLIPVKGNRVDLHLLAEALSDLDQLASLRRGIRWAKLPRDIESWAKVCTG